jgi:hypothetical protein
LFTDSKFAFGFPLARQALEVIVSNSSISLPQEAKKSKEKLH